MDDPPRKAGFSGDWSITTIFDSSLGTRLIGFNARMNFEVGYVFNRR